MDNPRLNLAERLPHIAHYQCVLCGATYSLDAVSYTCPACGEVGTLDVIYRDTAHFYTPAERPINFWQQRDLLPLAQEPPLAIQNLGNTPLIQADVLQHLAQKIGVAELSIKNDGLNLTGSLKDRASAMVVAHAKDNLKLKTIATASTGNAAAALAGICAAVEGVEAVIFVPASAPQAKIAQIIVFGAKVILVDGSYDTAFDLCGTACAEFGWYNRSTGINPITTEGKKTVAHEIVAQTDGNLPDVVVVSVGDGSIIGGVYKGFAEMYKRGWISHIPRLVGVQSSGSDALVHVWENDIPPQDMQPHPTNTIADSISSGLPRDRAKALRAVRESNGTFIRVTDAQILAAIPELAQSTGVFAEPAAAATYAALEPALSAGYIQAHERVLLLITGNGMKDVGSALQSVKSLMPAPTSPDLASVRKQIQAWSTT